MLVVTSYWDLFLWFSVREAQKRVDQIKVDKRAEIPTTTIAAKGNKGLVRSFGTNDSKFFKNHDFVWGLEIIQSLNNECCAIFRKPSLPVKAWSKGWEEAQPQLQLIILSDYGILFWNLHLKQQFVCNCWS